MSLLQVRSKAKSGTRARDRAAQATVTCGENRLVFIDGFLSQEECGRILDELQLALWLPSLTFQPQQDGTYRNVLTPFRVSETAHEEGFGRGLKALVRRLEKRLATLFDVDPTHLEPWQATDYPCYGKFDEHLDAGYWQGHHAGERVLTFLLYLNTPQKGGGTRFRALQHYVEARAGRLLAWNNLDANGLCNPAMIHSGTTVRQGKKTTLATWQRQRRFRRPWEAL